MQVLTYGLFSFMRGSQPRSQYSVQVYLSAKLHNSSQIFASYVRNNYMVTKPTGYQVIPSAEWLMNIANPDCLTLHVDLLGYLVKLGGSFHGNNLMYVLKNGYRDGKYDKQKKKIHSSIRCHSNIEVRKKVKVSNGRIERAALRTFGNWNPAICD